MEELQDTSSNYFEEMFDNNIDKIIDNIRFQKYEDLVNDIIIITQYYIISFANDENIYIHDKFFLEYVVSMCKIIDIFIGGTNNQSAWIAIISYFVEKIKSENLDFILLAFFNKIPPEFI
jgi:hypothetical protein